MRVDTADPEKQKSDPPFVSLLNIWKVVAHSALTCRFTPQGQVRGFEVPEEVKTAVSDSGDAYGISAEGLMGTFFTGIVQLPSSPVTVGDQWEMETVVTPFGTTENSSTGTFLGIAEMEGTRLAVIQNEYESSMKEKSGMISDFEATSKAIILFDIQTGNVWRHYTLAKGEMVLHLGDNEMLQSTTGKSSIHRVDN